MGHWLRDVLWAEKLPHLRFSFIASKLMWNEKLRHLRFFFMIKVRIFSFTKPRQHAVVGASINMQPIFPLMTSCGLGPPYNSPPHRVFHHLIGLSNPCHPPLLPQSSSVLPDPSKWRGVLDKHDPGKILPWLNMQVQHRIKRNRTRHLKTASSLYTRFVY